MTCLIINPTWQLTCKSVSKNNKVFCQKDYCEHIMQLIQIHFSLHPLIPTEHQSYARSASKIWLKCVQEQYNTAKLIICYMFGFICGMDSIVQNGEIYELVL
ncbi:13410_t:CDS:1 [Dentiscutata erythropus]|uniref:13410_t:CDS:1 n=1 Tax=Dentiscutata erythropus TaxID=1348616 RepID=A0A9N9N9U4_9GLOM|nr:13410_t:CDS:1 [Dentiscutata erythropus]